MTAAESTDIMFVLFIIMLITFVVIESKKIFFRVIVFFQSRLSFFTNSLQNSHALMSVLAFLRHVKIHLIADEQLMAAVAEAHGGGVTFVTVAEHHAVDAAADEERHRCVGAVGEAGIHHLLLVGVDEASRHVGSPCHAVGSSEG